jgi:hypothetical protein
MIERFPTGEDDAMRFGSKPRPWCTTSGWTIAFSGRTQLEAKQAGELPFIGALPA